LPTTKPKGKAHIFSPFGRKEKEKSKNHLNLAREKKLYFNLGLGRLFKFSKNRSDPIFGLLGHDEMPSMNLSTREEKGEQICTACCIWEGYNYVVEVNVTVPITWEQNDEDSRAVVIFSQFSDIASLASIPIKWRYIFRTYINQCFFLWQKHCEVRKGGAKGTHDFFIEKMGPSPHIMRNCFSKVTIFQRIGSNKLPNYRRYPKFFYFYLWALAKFG